MQFLQLSMLGILLMLQQTCNKNVEQNSQDLLNSQWELVSIGGDPIDSALKSPTLLFEKEGSKVNGFAGCNRFFGTYSVSADSISFNGLGATKMFCEQSQELEDNYLGRLDSVTGFAVSDNGATLTLLNDAGPLLEFSKTVAGQ